jgi:hypothetical protein
MPLFFVVGLLLAYAIIRIGWLLVRAGIAALCRRCASSAPARLRPWADRQAAWSLGEAWKKLWESR